MKRFFSFLLCLNLMCALLTGNIPPSVRAADANFMDITVTDGKNPIPGATVQLEQIFDSSLIGQDAVTIKKVGSFIKDQSIQSGAIYGDYFVCTERGAKGNDGAYTVTFHIYDLKTNQRIATATMSGDYFHGQYSQYKNNNSNFSTVFHHESDPFPLLYVSSAYDYRTVAVRIYQDNGVWKAEQMQIFDYYDAMHNDDGFYSCNVLLDNAGGYLYLTPIDQIYTAPADKQWFYKFEMPKYEPGTVVKITPDMALTERIETEYEYAPQGCFLMDGKIYQAFGLGSAKYNGKLGVFDLATGKYEAKINLNRLGCAEEPEACAFYNGSIYICSVKGNIWKITPNAYIPPKDVIAQDDMLLNTLLLNTDKDWEVGFLKTPASSQGTFLGQEICPNDKILRTGLLDVQGADYIYIPTPEHFGSEHYSGYYKWKVHWYGPNAQLGATTEESIDFIDYAEEQYDFDTTAKFYVPEGARYARICIASVFCGETQKIFQERTFLSDGGLTVCLYNQDKPSVEKTTLWICSASTVTDANGAVRFDVAPGAEFNITISAPGYETVKRIITSNDYENGLTAALQKSPHQHPLTKIEPAEPTKKQEGNILHWFCQTCGEHFADEEGKSPITREQIVIPKLPEVDSYIVWLPIIVAVASSIILCFTVTKKRRR